MQCVFRLCHVAMVPEFGGRELGGGGVSPLNLFHGAFVGNSKVVRRRTHISLPPTKIQYPKSGSPVSSEVYPINIQISHKLSMTLVFKFKTYWRSFFDILQDVIYIVSKSSIGRVKNLTYHTDNKIS